MGAASAPCFDQSRHRTASAPKHDAGAFRITRQQADEQVHAHSGFLAVVARGQAFTGILRADELGQDLFVEGQPFHDHDEDPVALGRAFRGDETVKFQAPDHGGQCSGMAVGDGILDGDGILGAAQALTLERSVKALDLLLAAQIYIENRRCLHVIVLA